MHDLRLFNKYAICTKTLCVDLVLIKELKEAGSLTVQYQLDFDCVTIELSARFQQVSV